jgi:Arc/MetJ family transcription regulator
VRTNIVIDDELMAAALELTGIATKREVVDRALRTLVRLARQGDIRSYRRTLHWEGDLDAQREVRSAP